MTTIKNIKVFIGSPGGLEPERAAARNIVENVNNSHSENWGCQIKLVGWEANLSSYNRAQELINQELDKCEYFIGILWDHWGSNPDNKNNKYTSGFEEEFERAKQNIEKKQMKDISLFFKKISEKQLIDPGESLKQVIVFRNKCIENNKPLFHNFQETRDFEDLFRAAIEAIGWNESSRLDKTLIQKSDQNQSIEIIADKSNEQNDFDGLIGITSTTFIQSLLQKPSDYETTNAYEIARFRLIACSTHRTGNDTIYLGNHDANLLFDERESIDFSTQEKRTLIDTGIAGFEHQNVPLWHYFSQFSNQGSNFDRVKLLAVVGKPNEKINAIQILQSLGHNTPVLDDYFNRERVLKDWLLEDKTIRNMNVILDFLRTNGELADLEIIERILDEVPEDHKNKVIITIIILMSKIDIVKAFDSLIKFDPEPFDKNSTNLLFAQQESLPTDTLVKCLTLKSDFIRKKAVLLLQNRKAIDVESAERLLTDSDFEIRFEAAIALLKHDRAPELSVIKTALTNTKPTGLMGLGFNLGGNNNDDKYFQKYNKHLLSQLNYGNLLKKVSECSIYDYLEISFLYQNFTKKHLSEIRINVNDEFKQYFDNKYNKLVAVLGKENPALPITRENESFVRQRLTNMAIDVLCAYGDKTDLITIRYLLDNDKVGELIESILTYLGRHGSWDDKDRILSMMTKYPKGQTILSINPVKSPTIIAATLYSIGKTRLIDLLQIASRIDLKKELLLKMSQKNICSFNDDVLIAEFNNQDNDYRKILALKCTQSLSQSRTKKLLSSYINLDDHRYYNVIHWLDLGASMPRQIVKTVTKFELEKFN